MKPEIGQTYLITTDCFFIAPDGNEYRAVFGTINAINSDKECLGITTNRGSTNWYVSIGNMMVAGCQIHYAIQTNNCNLKPFVRTVEHHGDTMFCKESNSRIYDANKGGD